MTLCAHCNSVNKVRGQRKVKEPGELNIDGLLEHATPPDVDLFVATLDQKLPVQPRLEPVSQRFLLQPLILNLDVVLDIVEVHFLV